MENVLKTIGDILLKLLKIALGVFLVTFIVYIFNLENKLIYYVVRPFLNHHYDMQVRDRKI